MATIFAQNIIEIAVRATLANRPHVNVWHLYREEDPNNSDEGGVLDFLNNWQQHIIPLVTDDYVLQSFEWRSLDPDDNNVGSVAPNVGVPFAGTQVGPAAPPNVAALIQKRTQNRPRGRRDGRMYLGGVPEGSINDDGTLTNGYVSTVNTALQAFLDGISDQPVGGVPQYPVVLETTPASRQPGTTPVTLSYRRITTVRVDPLVATQRERLRG